MTEPIITHNEDGSSTVVRLEDRDPAMAAVAVVADAVDRSAAEFRSSADLGSNLPDGIQEVLRDASEAITGTTLKVILAKAEAEKYRNDDRLFPAGRERLAAEAIAKADGEVTASLESADTNLAVAEAMLFTAARPTMPAGAELAARSDARMALDGVAPAGLPDAARALARRNDAVGALVTDSGWLDLYLASRGVHLDPELARAVRTSVQGQVFKAAVDSGEPVRVAAGRTGLALIHLRKAHVGAMAYRRNML